MEETENPYRATEHAVSKPPKRSTAHDVPPTIAYSIIGGLVGTAIVGTLILSTAPAAKLLGGVAVGAPLGAAIGYFLGRRKSDAP